MKIYSDQTVTKDHLSDLEERQNNQIAQLKLAVILSFAVNLALTIACYITVHLY